MDLCLCCLNLKSRIGTCRGAVHARLDEYPDEKGLLTLSNHLRLLSAEVHTAKTWADGDHAHVSESTVKAAHSAFKSYLVVLDDIKSDVGDRARREERAPTQIVDASAIESVKEMTEATRLINQVFELKSTDAQKEHFASDKMQALLNRIANYETIIEHQRIEARTLSPDYKAPDRSSKSFKRQLALREIRWKADFRAKDSTAQLCDACGRGEARRAEKLIARGAFVNGFVGQGYSPLFSAVSSGHFLLVRLLVENGADVNSIVNHPRHPWPLMEAVFRYDEMILRYLLENGANPNFYNAFNHQSPLWIAVNGFKPDMVRCLLEFGADRSMGDEAKGITPLQLAINLKQDDVVDILRETDIVTSSPS